MKRLRRNAALIFVLVLSLVLSMSALAYEVEADVRTLADVPADLSGKVVLLHSNDVHGALANYAYIAQLRNDFEARGAEVYLLDMGDFSQGDPNVSVSKGASAIEMMNAAGYAYATLGNHEFDYGYGQLMENLSKAEFTVLCADVLKDGESILPGHEILTTSSGLKLGLFGLETPETRTKVHPAHVQGLTFLANTSGTTALTDCAQAEIDALKAEGADLIIGLFHLGVDAESAPDHHRSADIYAATTGIDLILDGHSHTVMTAGENGEPIQSTGIKLPNVGVVIIDAASKTIEDRFLIPVEGLEKDETVDAVAQKIIEDVNAQYGGVFAQSEVTLNGAKAPNGNRDGETNNGDLVADAMLWSILHMDGAVTVDEDHVVAVTNGGGIRAAINPGDVTMKDVNTVLPFGNTVAVVYVKGSELLEALEASTYTTPIGGYPQTSGIQFTLDLTKEYDPNPETYPDSTYYGPASIQRVTITSINGKAFDPEATYAVVTNNFCSAGGDTYYVFKNASDQFDTGIPMDEAVMQYITEELGGVISAEKYAEPRGDQTYITEAAEEPATEPAPAEEPAPETPAAEYYTVVSGDCLWSIARRYYGTGTKWDTIYSFNHDVISDPNLIYIGQSLRVK